MKTAAKQAGTERKKTSTLGTRCWSCLRCQAPAQRYSSASRIGSVQSSSVVPFFTGHSVPVHGMVGKGATAETPKIQAPAQRYNRACRMERCAGWLCRATLAGQSVFVHGLVSRGATAETPKIQAPAQRYNRACRMERCAGWLCRATLAGQSVFVHGLVSRGATAETPKIERESTSASMQVWKTGERLQNAQPHCVYGTQCNESMEWRLWQGMWQ